MINLENPRKNKKLFQIVTYRPNYERFNDSISDKVAFHRKTVYINTSKNLNPIQ
jgi:hypothetical protein